MRQKVFNSRLLLFILCEFLMVPGQCSMPGMLNHHYTLTGHSTNIYRVNDSHLIWANFSKRLWYGISESRESFWSFPRVMAL